MSVAIVTDSDASLPPALAERYGIRLVPIIIHFEGEVFRTGVDINDVQLFARVDRGGKMPTTSAPSPGQFAEAYREAFEAGAESVVCFCVSSGVSATYSAAVAARETMADRDITVVDTRMLSMGQGLIVLAAAEAAQQGADKAAVLARARDVQERVHLYAALATLKYLAMSGRVGHIAAGMASLLQIKPILTLKDGRLDMLERVRTRKKAWARLMELVAQATGGRTPERMAIIHVADRALAEQFEAQLRAAVPCPDEIIIADFTPGLSVHAGPGLVGVALVAAR